MVAMRFLRLTLPAALCAIALLGVSLSGGQSQEPTDAATQDANAILHAVGGLGINHIQSTLGLIGVTADANAKNVYNAKQVEDLMTGTINGIEASKKLLRRLQDVDLSEDDEEYIDRMISVYNALQREAKALIAFAKSHKPSDAEAFDAARKAAVSKLGQLTEPGKVAAEPPPAPAPATEDSSSETGSGESKPGTGAKVEVP